MKYAIEAIEHDRWFRAHVAQGLAEANAPNTQWVTHEDAKESWAKKRDVLANRAEGRSH